MLVVMFDVSTKVDYALLIMVELGKPSDQEYQSLHDIAARHHISSKYLSQLVVPLKKAGLVESKEGKTGGYQITKSLKDITVRSIVEAVDGPLQIVKCMDSEKDCPVETTCHTKPIWENLKSDIYQLLDQKTLADIL